MPGTACRMFSSRLAVCRFRLLPGGQSEVARRNAKCAFYVVTNQLLVVHHRSNIVDGDLKRAGGFGGCCPLPIPPTVGLGPCAELLERVVGELTTGLELEFGG